MKFGPERMYIDCWVKKHTYDAFREVLGSGLQYHLQVGAGPPAAAGWGAADVAHGRALKSVGWTGCFRHDAGQQLYF